MVDDGTAGPAIGRVVPDADAGGPLDTRPGAPTDDRAHVQVDDRAALASVPAPRAAEPGGSEPPAAAPAPGAAPDADAAPAPARRLRTAKKKVTLPKAPKPSLAVNDTWRGARLFPASSLKSDREREMRATSVLLRLAAAGSAALSPA